MEKQQDNSLTLNKEMLRPFIEKEGKRIAETLSQARIKYGARYNKRNAYEQLYSKFGNPRYTPDKFYDEYVRILAKQSQLPASIRYTVRDIVLCAAKECIDAAIRAEQEKAAKPEAKPEKKTRKPRKPSTPKK